MGIIQDKLAKLTFMKDKATKFVAFESNPDFLNWRKDVVENRIHSYIKDALTGDTESEAGRAAILSAIRRYQELKYVTEDIFTTWKFTESELIKIIKKEEGQQPKA